ncbi:hypothetical protein FA95DRAFT_1403731 [Auriscalpium vulgare]|uniref:Uncharacterized protein n=1 Tax=Auriscalpium vulgare TaxID=40419 RepID=A0ACB8RRU6_9AGAM|nr:hypothetical protein FA95DRAFT_1403731 [Auriscalpium vulgare]
MSCFVLLRHRRRRQRFLAPHHWHQRRSPTSRRFLIFNIVEFMPTSRKLGFVSCGFVVNELYVRVIGQSDANRLHIEALRRLLRFIARTPSAFISSLVLSLSSRARSVSFVTAKVIFLPDGVHYDSLSWVLTDRRCLAQSVDLRVVRARIVNISYPIQPALPILHEEKQLGRETRMKAEKSPCPPSPLCGQPMACS